MKMGLSRRRLLQVTGVTGVTALGGCLGSGKSGNSDYKIKNAPIPKNPGKHTYAIAGTGNSGTTVQYYSNWKCPYCARFSTGFLHTVMADYVEPGKIDLEFRPLVYVNGQPWMGPDAPNAAEAGQAVWNVDPQSFWKYYEYVFSNQPSEKKQWATTDKLLSFMKKSGVNHRDTIKTQMNANKYDSQLHKVDSAAQKAGVNSTPMLVINGQTVAALNKKKVTKLLDSATN